MPFVGRRHQQLFALVSASNLFRRYKKNLRYLKKVICCMYAHCVRAIARNLFLCSAKGELTKSEYSPARTSIINLVFSSQASNSRAITLHFDMQQDLQPY
ncbi:MAG: hypothetical protein ACRDL7_04030, partial [Gaiellaceae bacterium]